MGSRRGVIRSLVAWLAFGLVFGALAGLIGYFEPTLNLDHSRLLTGWACAWFLFRGWWIFYAALSVAAVIVAAITAWADR